MTDYKELKNVKKIFRSCQATIEGKDVQGFKGSFAHIPEYPNYITLSNNVRYLGTNSKFPYLGGKWEKGKPFPLLKAGSKITLLQKTDFINANVLGVLED